MTNEGQNDSEEIKRLLCVYQIPEDEDLWAE